MHCIGAGELFFGLIFLLAVWFLMNFRLRYLFLYVFPIVISGCFGTNDPEHASLQGANGESFHQFDDRGIDYSRSFCSREYLTRNRGSEPPFCVDLVVRILDFEGFSQSNPKHPLKLCRMDLDSNDMWREAECFTFFNYSELRVVDDPVMGGKDANLWLTWKNPVIFHVVEGRYQISVEKTTLKEFSVSPRTSGLTKHPEFNRLVYLVELMSTPGLLARGG